MGSKSRTCLILLLVACGLAASHAAQAREAPAHSVAFPMYHAAAAAGHPDDAAAEEPAAVSDVLDVTKELHLQRGASSAARAADTHAAGIPAHAMQLETDPYPGDGLATAGGDWAAEDQVEAGGALLVVTRPGGEAEGSGIPVGKASDGMTLRKHLSDIAAARLEPHLWRLQREHPGADISLDRSSWPCAVVVSGPQLDNDMTLRAVDAARTAAYGGGSGAGKPTTVQHDHQMHFAVSLDEQFLLERFDAGQLLTDLEILHQVSITPQDVPEALVIEGHRDAIELAALEIRQTIAVGWSSARVARPISAIYDSGEGPSLMLRTIDVRRDFANYLASSSGAQNLFTASDYLRQVGVCLAFRPSISFRARRQDSDISDMPFIFMVPATISLLGGGNTDWAEHRIRRWLAQPRPEDLDTFEPVYDTSGSKVSSLEFQHVDMFDPQMEAGAHYPPFGAGRNSRPAHGRRWCARTLQEVMEPLVLPDDGNVWDPLSTETDIAMYNAPHGHWPDRDRKMRFMLATFLVHLLVLPVLAWTAILAFCGGRSVALAGTRSARRRVADSGGNEPEAAGAIAKGGAAANTHDVSWVYVHSSKAPDSHT